MIAMDMYKYTNVWDNRYNLPLLPNHNNPWIYSAYADIVAQQYDGSKINRELIYQHFLSCEEQSGLFWRWPHKTGEGTSHDEIMGAVYYDERIANRIVDYLSSSGGDFNIKKESYKYPLTFNVYRFPWLYPYIATCAGKKVNLFWQLIWAITVVLDAWNKDCHPGGRLRIYLMMLKMKQYWLCRKVSEYWIKKVTALGQTFKSCLAVEPKENPIMSQLAKEEWRL